MSDYCCHCLYRWHRSWRRSRDEQSFERGASGELLGDVPGCGGAYKESRDLDLIVRADGMEGVLDLYTHG